MPNLKDIRNRISSVRNTRKITSAMKLIAATKLRRAQQAVEASRPYSVKMQEVITDLAGRVEADAHPLLVASETETNAVFLFITSDRGLCAGFNNNLLRPAWQFIQEKQRATESLKALTVGRKGFQYLNRRKVEVLENFTGVNGAVTFPKAKQIAGRAMELFLSGEADRVYIVYNEFVSAIQTKQIVRQLLPMPKMTQHHEAAGDEHEVGEALAVNAGGEDYIYEPDAKSLLGRLLPNSIEMQVFQALLESEASEHASRMTAMENATKNASDMINNLTLQYNRARQAYITKELVEIVSGAESLKG
jgi:F-type H+-transporting ATPase subunit gamma